MPTFTNRATLSYNGNTVNSNTVTGNVVEVLTVTKTAVGNTYTANDDVTYVVSIRNVGTVAYTDLTVTDNLGAYEFNDTTLYPLDYVEGTVAYYQNGTIQAAPEVSDTQPLTFTGITVPAGGNAMLIYEARVNEFAPLASESTITNTVSVACGCASTDTTAEETICTLDEPNLSITKNLCPLTVTECGEITYTFVIQNTGNTAAVATDNVVVTDIFDPVLSNISVTIGGEPTSAYTYNEETGEFATNEGAITVPAAEFTQDPESGSWTVTPGVTVITVTGTI